MKTCRGMPSVSDQVRAACARVAARARAVKIEEDAIEGYAKGLEPAPAAARSIGGGRESRAAFVICLDAINFGSGWWPTIRKRPGLSGYLTMAAGVTERFESRGAWSTEELTAMDAETIAEVVGQDHVTDPLRAALAKARTSDAAALVAPMAHAVHGAIGITAELDLQLYTRRLHEGRADYGAEGHWNRVVGRALLAADGGALDFMRAALIPSNDELRP